MQTQRDAHVTHLALRNLDCPSPRGEALDQRGAVPSFSSNLWKRGARSVFDDRRQVLDAEVERTDQTGTGGNMEAKGQELSRVDVDGIFHPVTLS